MRQTQFAISIQHKILDMRSQLLFEPVAEPADMFVAFGHFLLGQFSSGPKGNNVRHRFGSAATLALLMSAMLERKQTDTFSNKKRARSFRRINLMRGQRKQIASQSLHVKR